MNENEESQPGSRKSLVICDADAEQATLGSMLLVDVVADEVSQILRPAHFFYDGNKLVYESICRLRNSGNPVDPMIVSQELESCGKLTLAGGNEYLMRLMDVVPHAANAKYYATQVRSMYFRRQLRMLGVEASEDAAKMHCEVGELLAAQSKKIHDLLEESVSEGVPDIATLATRSLEMRYETVEKRRIATGFCDIDAMLTVLANSTLIILAARPSMGKTALACNIVSNICAAGGSVYFASLEQADVEISTRIMCALADVDTRKHATADCDEWERERLNRAANDMSNWKLVIDQKNPHSVAEIAAACRVRKNTTGLDLVVIDYLQLVEPDDKRIPREQQVARISRGLKALAKQLEIPVLALAQLNRAVESRETKRPGNADLRESGSLEQDADVISFLFRPNVYDKSQPVSETELIVTKQRSGPTGTVYLHWMPEYMVFKNSAKSQQKFGEPPQGEHEEEWNYS